MFNMCITMTFVLVLVTFLTLIWSPAGSSVVNDLSLNHYTPDGEVAQLAYAAKAVGRSTPRLSFYDEASGSVLFFAINKIHSPLSIKVRSSIQIAKETGIVIMTAGYHADCDYLLNHIHAIIQRHCLMYGESPNLDSIASQVSTWVTRGLYIDNSDSRINRPLASSCAIAAVDLHRNRNRLVQVDNTGLITGRKVSMLGSLASYDQVKLVDLVTGTTPLYDGTMVVDTGSTDGGEQDESLTNLLEKCRRCLDILFNEDENVLEACILHNDGRISHSSIIGSASGVIDWLKSTLSTSSVS